MPSNILTTDTSFPQLTEEQSTDEKFGVITNYLYMLLEQLRYSMANLGRENFNDAEFDSIANIITEPVYVQLEGVEGEVASLHLTAQSLTSRITNGEGEVSSLTQTVNSITLTVSNGEYSSTIRLLMNGIVMSSRTIQFTGMVTFADLEGSGTTVINGDNIQTGTISAIDIYGCIIEGSVFRSVLDYNGDYGGEIEFYYLSTRYLAGGIRGMERGTLSEQREPDGTEPIADVELLRLAVPRRVFTMSQLLYAVDRITWLFENRELVGGLRWVEEPSSLRFFFGRLAPTSDWQEKLAAKFRADFGDSL